MSISHVGSSTSSVRFGFARVDITPPVGTYHRLWGAARHDRSTGIHRPTMGDVLAFGPDAPHGDCGGCAPCLIRAHLDLPGLVNAQHQRLVDALARGGGLPAERVDVAYSHTHAAGWFTPDRREMPGGEHIDPYLERVESALMGASRQAVAGMQKATITYATGRCTLAANRDYWDEDRQAYVCGTNPEGEADDTVVVARIVDMTGRPACTVVNYACHPTTLAWENTQISPDYAGAMREEVERATGAPCSFALGACGDLGPREGFVGDGLTADKNGRQLGYAALEALMSMGPPRTDFRYEGPVVSGATLGTWTHVPLSPERVEAAGRFSGGMFTLDLPLSEELDRAALKAEVDSWSGQEREADASGDPQRARDCSARAERARRWLARFDDLPEGSDSYPLRFSAYRMGDAIWATCGGEPYSLVQTELRRRFADRAILFSPLVGDLQVGYILPADRFGLGLYQEETASLARGSLEALIEALAVEMRALG